MLLRVLRCWTITAATVLTLAALYACGSTSGGDVAVARITGTPITITRAAVSHWMDTVAGGNYYELSARHTAPAGLVSDPPNYPRCVKRLEAAAAASPKKILKLTPLELLEKCRQMNVALKEQATNYLLAAQWVIGFNRELGVTASNNEVVGLYNNLKAKEFPTAAAQRQFFASQHLTLADELFIVKLDVLKNKDSARVEAGGQKAYKVILAAEKRWTGKTTCRPGYVVAHCREYKGGEEQEYRNTPSPAVLMEQVAALSTGRCTNFA